MPKEKPRKAPRAVASSSPPICSDPEESKRVAEVTTRDTPWMNRVGGCHIQWDAVVGYDEYNNVIVTVPEEAPPSAADYANAIQRAKAAKKTTK